MEEQTQKKSGLEKNVKHVVDIIQKDDGEYTLFGLHEKLRDNNENKMTFEDAKNAVYEAEKRNLIRKRTFVFLGGLPGEYTKDIYFIVDEKTSAPVLKDSKGRELSFCGGNVIAVDSLHGTFCRRMYLYY